MRATLAAFVVCVGIQHVFGAQIPFKAPSTYENKGGLITDEVHSYVSGLLDRWNSTGLSVAVIKDDQVDFGSYGISTVDGDAVTPDTLYGIASNSKLFLALSVGLVLEERNMTWKTKARDVFAGSGLWEDEMIEGIAVQDMLSHRTGYPRHDASGQWYEGGVAEMIYKLRYLKPSAELRETFQYNNLMYETLSYLPELFYNQTFESYIAEHLFKPLNMSSATYSVSEAEASGNLADGFMPHLSYVPAGELGSLRATVPYFLRPGQERVWAGAGGVIASARDLVPWVKMLLNEGRHPETNETVVPADIVKHVATGVSVDTGAADFPELSPVVYGAGQRRFTYRGVELIEHGGHNPGYHTQITRFPHNNIGIIVLSNDERAYRLIDVAKWKIADSLLGFNTSVDWEGRYLREREEELENAEKKVVPPPSNPELPNLPFSEIEGTYSHPTYGNLTLCYTIAALPECVDLVTHPVIQSAPEGVTLPIFVAQTDKFFSSHIVLQHFDGNMFNVSLVWSNYDTRREEVVDEGQDLTIGWDEQYTATFVQMEGEQGFALTGNFWGAGKGVPETDDIKGEVWFARPI